MASGDIKGDVSSKTIYEIQLLYLKDLIYIRASMEVFLSSVFGKNLTFIKLISRFGTNAPSHVPSHNVSDSD